jgi:hypothetical protein
LFVCCLCLQGRNMFDALTLEGEDKFAGLAFLLIGTIAGAAVFMSILWVLWRWLALGHVPKPVAALRRLARAMRAATIDGATAAPGTGVSKKYLLDIELELTGKPGGKSHSGSIEDAAAWSKVCAVTAVKLGAAQCIMVASARADCYMPAMPVCSCFNTCIIQHVAAVGIVCITQAHHMGCADSGASSVGLQRPSLRHRYTLGGAGAEAEGGDGDLLKAIR